MTIQFFRGAIINLKGEYLFSRYLEENMELNCPVLCKAIISDKTDVSVGEYMDVDGDGSRSNGSVPLANPTTSPSHVENPSCEFH